MPTFTSTSSITTPLAALPTIFTAPCSTSWLLTTTKAPSQYPLFPTTGPASCDPPNWTANLDSRGFQFYSPAICPSGFHVGPGCQILQAKTADGFPAVQPGETAAFCVPSGQSCTSDTTDFRGGIWGATSNADDTSFTVGPALQIRFQASDLPALETHPLIPGLRLSSVASAAAPVTTGGSTTPRTTTASPSRSTTTSIAKSTPASSALTAASATAASAASSVILNTATTASQAETPTSPQSPGPDVSGQGIANGNSLDTGLIAVVASVLTFSSAICAFVIFRLLGSHRRPRWRSCTSILLPWRKPRGLVPVGLGAWIGRRAIEHEQPPDDAAGPSSTRRLEPITSVLQIDTEMGLPTVVVVVEEAEQKPLGSTDNPAELEGDQAQRLSQRASWVSRLLSRVAARSSSTTTRSSSQSRWTQRSLARSGGWEPFPEEKGGGGGGRLERAEVDFYHDYDDLPAVPRLARTRTRSRPRTMSSSPPDHAREEAAGSSRLSAPPAITRFRSFDRLSAGTFGAVIVRGRSPGSNTSRQSGNGKE